MRTISERTADKYLRFSRVVRLEPDISHLAKQDILALKELIEAADLTNRIFLRQNHSQSIEILDRLLAESKESRKAQKVLKVFQIFNGPIGRSYKAGRYVKLVECDRRPAGGTLYPSDLSLKELYRYKKQHPEPDQVFELESHYTLVRRRNQELITVPFRQEYREELEEIAERLQRASILATDPGFRKYLASRAEALLDDYYYQSDLDWVDCEESPIDITIGPIEYYFDRLDGKKAFYEARISIKNETATRRLDQYRQYLQQLENNIPFHSHRDLSATILPLHAVDTLFVSGENRSRGVGIVVAQILPNDERVAQVKGRKTLFFKNIMKVRFQKEESDLNVFLAPEFRRLFSGESIYEFVVGHEISHALGPKLTRGGQEVQFALGNRQNMIEEIKASCLAMYNLQFLMGQGLYTQEEVDKIYVSRVFEIIPFLVPKFDEAHRMEDFLTLNYLLEHKGIEFRGGLISINFPKIFEVMENLAQNLLELQFGGDIEKVDEFIQKYFRPDDEAIKYLCQKKQSLKPPRYYIIEQPLAEKLAGRSLL